MEPPMDLADRLAPARHAWILFTYLNSVDTLEQARNAELP